MPELPEVETTRRGIAPYLDQQQITSVVIHDRRLRWPVPDELESLLTGQRVTGVTRRAKYLLITFEHGTLIIHLGMSGSLRVITDQSPRLTHDHVELTLADGTLLRFNDPRRFGCWLWQAAGEAHPLLAGLGPEPLDPTFTGGYLFRQSRGRKAPIKTFIMDNHVVVGVGNIYANEALFSAGIHPKRAAGRVSADRMARLAEAIRDTLSAAILMGGTTLRDFVNSDGKPGYFAQSLNVYGRAGQPCVSCSQTLKEVRLGQRSTVYCPSCQR
ncbi:MAG: bifunctional DNA-formamidopyrimidine glycosylase/DNA-(apurinic or apyrimidinic site) lyase [Marinobacter sp.]|nr:bifunctional DNA-formamidopyrimidine glycosylase/DNA-(apurinic or apyrimidinic site) lyase [Marinobacter sp.]